MKNSLNLVLAVMLFVVLGCSLLNRKQEKIDTPTPTPTGGAPVAEPTKTTSLGTVGLSIDKFNELKIGMTYEEVVNTLGSEGTETRSSQVGKIKLSSYKWEGDKSQRVFCTFRDDKLTMKSQTGFSTASKTKDGEADLSMEKYNQLKDGMSYQEAVKVIGSEGAETRSSRVGKYEIKTFIWKGANYSSVIATFRNDELYSKSQSRVK